MSAREIARELAAAVRTDKAVRLWEAIRRDPCKCDDCGHVCRRDQLEDIDDIEQRVDYHAQDPRYIEPAGQCPECGALSYADTPAARKAEKAARAARALFAAAPELFAAADALCKNYTRAGYYGVGAEVQELRAVLAKVKRGAR